MSESRQIQRVQKGMPGGAIMTPQGPAIIQVIDMAGGGLVQGGGNAPRKPSGINIFSAIARRWWLVALVTLVIGGAAIFAGNNFIKPQYEAKVMVSYHDPSANAYARGPIYDIAHRACEVLKSRDIPLLAMQNSEMQTLLPQLVQGKNIHDPEVELAILDYFKPVVDCDETPGSEIINLYADQPNKEAAEKIANAFGTAFIQYCRTQVDAQDKDERQAYEDKLAGEELNLKSIHARISELKSKYDFELNNMLSTTTIQQIADLQKREAEAKLDYMLAEANLKAVTGPDGKPLRRPKQELDSEQLKNDEMAKDSVLQAYEAAEVTAINNYNSELAAGKTEQHPDVVRARQMMDLAKRNVLQRKEEIKAAIDAKIQKRFNLQDQVDAAKAKDNLDKADGMIKVLDKQLDSLSAESRRLSTVKDQLDDLQQAAASIVDRRKHDQTILDDLMADEQKNGNKGTFQIEERATNAELKEDKRIKVEAGGMVGGLFLGILLALLIDRFDKRLRDPRDVEPMLNAPLLGSIPKIQELKRAKGEQARNLIAEEFRIIRTQVLFGNPELQYKIIAVTSPSPGDGKTSLAVNLAISIAKAGRRVLLIDGDLRKPDIHRVFNIPDSPGFAELISASSEPAQVIRKSDIDGLDVLPAGTPIMRPSELLSRPEMSRILQALGELYDHVILDTAPLLPVSDTHVLVGMVDAVMVSFNASVERDIVNMTQEILFRSHANVIGSVMNQVPYKQTASYHRGKSAYDSYYNSPRGAYRAGAAKGDTSMASMNRKEVA